MDLEERKQQTQSKVQEINQIKEEGFLRQDIPIQSAIQDCQVGNIKLNDELITHGMGAECLLVFRWHRKTSKGERTVAQNDNDSGRVQTLPYTSLLNLEPSWAGSTSFSRKHLLLGDTAIYTVSHMFILTQCSL